MRLHALNYSWLAQWPFKRESRGKHECKVLFIPNGKTQDSYAFVLSG